VRRYTAKEIAEAVLVYDELRRCGAVSKGELDVDKIAAGYRKDWGKDVDFDLDRLSATVTDLPPRGGR